MYNEAKTRVRTMEGDLEHFLIMMELHLGSTLSPFLFALVIDKLTQYIKGTSLVYVIHNDIVLIDKTCNGINNRPEIWRQTLESKGFMLSMTKTEHLEYKFSGVHKEEVGVKIDAQIILKRGSFK